MEEDEELSDSDSLSEDQLETWTVIDSPDLVHLSQENDPVPCPLIASAAPLNDISVGDHVLYISQDAPYRRMYQSAVVVGKNADGLDTIENVQNGVVNHQLTSSQTGLYLVHYSSTKYTRQEVVQRATQRYEMEEKRYHALNNNSHHFATWCTSGRENNLYKVLQYLTLEQQCSSTCTDSNGDISNANPILFKKSVGSISELKASDHVIIINQNWIIESIDKCNNTFSAYTYKNKKVQKETLHFKNVHLILYDKVICDNFHHSEKVLQDAQVAHDTKPTSRSQWKSDDEFATFLKTGRSISFSSNSLMDIDAVNKGLSYEDEGTMNTDEQPFVSYTRITPDTCIDEGDHLVLKKTTPQCQHVIVCHVHDNSTMIVTPSATGSLTQIVKVTEYSQTYRINYKYSLPGEQAVERAICKKARDFFKSLSDPELQFKLVTWAKIGIPCYFSQLPSKHVIVQKWPFRYERVISAADIKAGDHLFEKTPTYWFHYLVTEKKSDTQLSIIYQLRTKVTEEAHNINVRSQMIYKVIYPECFPAEIAIQNARRDLSNGRNYKLEGRMKFVPRAKTGSEDGVFIDMLLNSNLPSSRSCIHSFTQLNPGDYLVYKKGPYWHHCLVHCVISPLKCVIYKYRHLSGVTELDLTLNDEISYYRLNYNNHACIKVEQTLVLAADAIKSSKGLGRQTFVQYTKTLDKSEIEIDSLVDDRLLLPRERVNSVNDLKVGDHIEWPAQLLPALHHMFVYQHDGTKCHVIHRYRLGSFSTQENDIMEIKDALKMFEEGKVYRIMYSEHIPTEEGLTEMIKILTGDKGRYHLFNNNCEHLVTKAMTGFPISIQVEEKIRQLLISSTKSVGASLIIFKDLIASSCGNVAINLALAGIQNGARALAMDIAEGGTAVTFQLGAKAVLSATALGLVATGFISLVVVLLCEGVIFGRSLYKLNRKKKFHKISKAQYKKELIKSGCQTAAAIAGGVGGAVAGQIVIPVPLVGATVGIIGGTVIGMAVGYGAGSIFSLAVQNDRLTSLPPLVSITLKDTPSVAKAVDSEPLQDTVDETP